MRVTGEGGRQKVEFKKKVVIVVSLAFMKVVKKGIGLARERDGKMLDQRPSLWVGVFFLFHTTTTNSVRKPLYTLASLVASPSFRLTRQPLSSCPLSSACHQAIV